MEEVALPSSTSITALGILFTVLGCGGGDAGGGSTGPKTVFGPPASIVIYSGNSQTGAAGAKLADPLCTNVLDAAGHKLIGVVVTYTVATGGGTIGSPTTPSTDAGGIATSGAWTLGSAAGKQTVVASSPGAGSITFSATAN
jgi:hypothetical protein